MEQQVYTSSLWPLQKAETVLLGTFVAIFLVYVVAQIVLVPWIESVTR